VGSRAGAHRRHKSGSCVVISAAPDVGEQGRDPYGDWTVLDIPVGPRRGGDRTAPARRTHARRGRGDRVRRRDLVRARGARRRRRDAERDPHPSRQARPRPAHLRPAGDDLAASRPPRHPAAHPRSGGAARRQAPRYPITTTTRLWLLVRPGSPERRDRLTQDPARPSRSRGRRRRGGAEPPPRSSTASTSAARTRSARATPSLRRTRPERSARPTTSRPSTARSRSTIAPTSPSG
jgi:hypothetical protein